MVVSRFLAENELSHETDYSSARSPVNEVHRETNERISSSSNREAEGEAGCPTRDIYLSDLSDLNLLYTSLETERNETGGITKREDHFGWHTGGIIKDGRTI